MLLRGARRVKGEEAQHGAGAAWHFWGPSKPFPISQDLPGRLQAAAGPRGARERGSLLSHRAPGPCKRAPADCSSPQRSMEHLGPGGEGRGARQPSRRRRRRGVCFPAPAATQIRSCPARKRPPGVRSGRLASPASGGAGHSGLGAGRRAPESNGVLQRAPGGAARASGPLHGPGTPPASLATFGSTCCALGWFRGRWQAGGDVVPQALPRPLSRAARPLAWAATQPAHLAAWFRAGGAIMHSNSVLRGVNHSGAAVSHGGVQAGGPWVWVAPWTEAEAVVRGTVQPLRRPAPSLSLPRCTAAAGWGQACRGVQRAEELWPVGNRCRRVGTW